ncbi:MAG TPA: LuxR C-terminal-related transcriptional regulator [Anaerolineales bacterium]|nr:LuxR C-terminal-related transcriptional regulator [Anaerolineales bacterium]
MAAPILATKLYIPPPRPKVVTRTRLIERLNEGLHHKLTLISAPAGFGKTTLVSEWVSNCGRSVSWLSLDKGENDPARFLTYFISSLQIISSNFGEKVLGLIQASQPQPPSLESILTPLLNEITAIPQDFILVLDDYHVIDSKHIDSGLAFLIEHLPPQMHLVIVTREDPDLPLARLRGRDQLTELRAADLRFTSSEAAEFLNQVMGLNLSAQDIGALETRTEGWIAGLQLAAISMQGQKDVSNFIKSFTGSHHFVMDYLVEEVLKRQPEDVQNFLLRTSVLNRLCGSLCDAVLLDASASSEETLEYLERANLFLIPLDNERRWHRYHHLFSDLLRQRLNQSVAASVVKELHIRASQWYEDQNLVMEAFHHAAAANDVERAERLIEGKGVPLHFSGGVVPILEWLDSLPDETLNSRPSLWWRHAALLLINGQTIGVGEKLQAAELALSATLQGTEPDEKTRNLIGQIASARATLALTRYDVQGMLTQSSRALEYLSPGALFNRATANWVLGFAQFLLGNRLAARQAFTEGIALSQKSAAMFPMILATIGLGNIQEADNELYQAAETYRRVLEWAGEHPQQIIHEAHLGLARVLYEWNDLEGAEQHGQHSLVLARQYEGVIDRYIICEVFLARLKLARGDVDGAAAALAQTNQTARQQNFVHRIPEVAAAQILTLIRQGNLSVAANLAETHKLPLSLARVHLARGDTDAALKILETWGTQAEAKDWKDERLRVKILQSLAHQANGEMDVALQRLGEALTLAEPSGFIRLFVDEGTPMAEILSEAAARDVMPAYVRKLLDAFAAEPGREVNSKPPPSEALIEPLSQRELEVLQLIAKGLSNQEISERLFLALDTVKGHNRRIYDKLQVQRRTEAIARARELDLL